MKTLRKRRHLLALIAATPVATGMRDVGAQPAPAATIAAASDLKFALDEVIALFERETGQRLRVTYGSSGQFFSQILQGAPFHLFLSADESFVFRLAEAGRTRDRGRLYALGRIGILVGKRSPLKADGSLRDLAAALTDGRLRKFAIASPEHAPYGMRAREALQHAGLWQAIGPRLVFGENVSQAAQFVTSGAAEAGLIAYSLARAPQVAQAGRFDLIPEAWHQPLTQRVVLIKDAPRAAVDFYDFLATLRVQTLMMRYGFTPPQAASAVPSGRG